MASFSPHDIVVPNLHELEFQPHFRRFLKIILPILSHHTCPNRGYKFLEKVTSYSRGLLLQLCVQSGNQRFPDSRDKKTMYFYLFSLKNSVFKTQEIKRHSLFICSSGNLPSACLISGAVVLFYLVK